MSPIILATPGSLFLMISFMMGRWAAMMVFGVYSRWLLLRLFSKPNTAGQEACATKS
jgi:hypothetical protein